MSSLVTQSKKLPVDVVSSGLEKKEPCVTKRKVLTNIRSEIETYVSAIKSEHINSSTTGPASIARCNRDEAIALTDLYSKITSIVNSIINPRVATARREEYECKKMIAETLGISINLLMDNTTPAPAHIPPPTNVVQDCKTNEIEIKSNVQKTGAQLVSRWATTKPPVTTVVEKVEAAWESKKVISYDVPGLSHISGVPAMHLSEIESSELHWCVRYIIELRCLVFIESPIKYYPVGHVEYDQTYFGSDSSLQCSNYDAEHMKTCEMYHDPTQVKSATGPMILGYKGVDHTTDNIGLDADHVRNASRWTPREGRRLVNVTRQYSFSIFLRAMMLSNLIDDGNALDTTNHTNDTPFLTRVMRRTQRRQQKNANVTTNGWTRAGGNSK